MDLVPIEVFHFLRIQYLISIQITAIKPTATKNKILNNQPNVLQTEFKHLNILQMTMQMIVK